MPLKIGAAALFGFNFIAVILAVMFMLGFGAFAGLLLLILI